MELILLLIGILAVLAVTALFKYFTCYCTDFQFIKIRMASTGSWKELVYWKKELNVLRLSLLPGITPKKAKSVLRRLDRSFQPEQGDGLSYVLAPSLWGICICAICLAGSTFAWFTASQSSNTQMIQAAEYQVDCSVLVQLKDGKSEGVLPDANGCFLLEAKQTYSLKLQASGTAAKGYALLQYGTDKDNSNEYHTQPILAGEEIEIKITPANRSYLKVVGQWGTSSKTPAEGESDQRFFAYSEKSTVYSIEAPASGTVAIVEEEEIPATGTTVPASSVATSTTSAETTASASTAASTTAASTAAKESSSPATTAAATAPATTSAVTSTAAAATTTAAKSSLPATTAAKSFSFLTIF